MKKGTGKGLGPRPGFVQGESYAASVRRSARLVELRTASDYRLIEDAERLKKYRPAMAQVARELGEFLK